MNIDVYADLASAAPFLRGLAALGTPWTFDIESYDGAAYPSRKEVSTNPHHPDFRVRGVAFATAKDRGAYVDLVSDEQSVDVEGLAALRAAFASDAEKRAFNGGFDENGLVYTGWVPVIRNRTGDGMLSMIALGDGTHVNVKLETGITVLLRQPYHWDEDKSLMRDIPLGVVAAGAVRDACYTHELVDLLDNMAERGEHIEWSKLGVANFNATEEEDGYGETEGQDVRRPGPDRAGGDAGDARPDGEVLEPDPLVG